MAKACGEVSGFRVYLLRGGADLLDQQTEDDLSIGERIDRLLGKRR